MLIGLIVFGLALFTDMATSRQGWMGLTSAFVGVMTFFGGYLFLIAHTMVENGL
ncbi:MAG: hypothetical protein GY913_05130 [Proteobacteria bacterium]|nr:hypothetical protein [Pseudomonadota bacterium]MCP4916284.1 hypothetical protein [Pseudomonadota bacterium]